MNMTLAIIGTGEMARIIALNARQMGVICIFFSNVPPVFKLTDSELFFEYSIFDIDTICQECRKIKVQGVIPSTEITIKPAYMIAEALGLCGLPIQTVNRIFNKYWNRRSIDNLSGIENPPYFLVEDFDDLKKVSCGFPVIVKPLSKSGKVGVMVANSIEELPGAYAFARKESGGQPAIVEEYVSGGRQYSVETLSYHKRHHLVQITRKISSGPPHCVDLGHHQPAELDDKIKRRLGSIIPKALTAWGVDNSPCHIEIIIKDSHIFLIECNCRPGGDFISWPLIDFSTGFSYMKASISIALDLFDESGLDHLETHYSGVYFVTKQTEFLKPLLDVCEKFPWCVYRHCTPGGLKELKTNDCFETDCFMYLTDDPNERIVSDMNEEAVNNYLK